MAFPRNMIGKPKPLTWKIVLILTIVLTDLHLTKGDICTKIADCSCQDPTRLMCSGSSSLSIYQLKQLVPAAYVLYIDIRGRYISQSFLLDLVYYFPRLKVLRIDKRLCSLVIPLLGKLHFTIIHNCFIESTTADLHHLTSSFPQEITTQAIPTRSDTPSTAVIFSTTPLHFPPSSTQHAPNVTQFVPVVPSHDPGDIVITAGHSAGFYVSIVIPGTALLSIIIGVLSCCVRWFTGKSVLCFGTREDRRRDNGHDLEAGQSDNANIPSSNQQEGAEGGDNRSEPSSDTQVVKLSASSAPSSRVAVTKKADGDLTISEMNVAVNKDSDITLVKVPLQVANIATVNVGASNIDSIQADVTGIPHSDKSAVKSAESTLVAVPDTAPDQGTTDQGALEAAGQLPLPSRFIEPATSTPIGSKKKPSFSFMSCFRENNEGYRALSPASAGTPASAYQTPAANVSPSAESIVSAAPLITFTPDANNKEYPSTRSRKEHFELLPGVEGRKRMSRKTDVRHALQKAVEMSASTEDINQTRLKKP